MDINEQSTTEEINEYVENVVKEVEADRKGDQPADKKPDAEIVADRADDKPNETPVSEKPSGDEAADVENEGDEEESWINDDVKAEASAYGIEESELEEFASREELDRALRLFDKTALEAGRKAMAEEQPRNDKGQFDKKPEAEEPSEGRYEINLDGEVYDADIVQEFTRMRDHYESRLEALEARFSEADALAEEQRFDGLVDSLKHDDLFGKTGKENSKQMKRREDLHVQVKAQLIGLEQLGRPAELNADLVQRVARMVFADEFGKKDRKTLTRKVSKQSNSRQGGGSTRATDLRESPRDEADRLYRELTGA